MITQRVTQLKQGDEFTPDAGASWHRVAETHKVEVYSTGDVILVATDEGMKFWWWENDEVVVKV